MPSRPVLIGRGLVPTPYKTKHHTPYGVEEKRQTLRYKATTPTGVGPRPHAVPNQHTHPINLVVYKGTYGA